jgi:hypothetical protein
MLKISLVPHEINEQYHPKILKSKLLPEQTFHTLFKTSFVAS